MRLLTSTPNKTVHFNGSDLLFHHSHVGLVVPRLHIQNYAGLGNDNSLLGFLLVVRLESVLSDFRCLCTLLLVIGAELKFTTKNSMKNREFFFNLLQSLCWKLTLPNQHRRLRRPQLFVEQLIELRLSSHRAVTSSRMTWYDCTTSGRVDSLNLALCLGPRVRQRQPERVDIWKIDKILLLNWFQTKKICKR